eukprot:CAMPEP_0178414916 /NCGR_PEP_ID=MMETSP0689_2-20121128/23282_1 /TAXON_ID=160604 /ORGANISM="Amphidinium massartii, Strain CS-259" /LENGTH=254 /DNA_ID=CAMNT_0020036219 /DNA_START=137 /DNA_END=901 /DNA_ORIENTATION=+
MMRLGLLVGVASSMCADAALSRGMQTVVHSKFAIELEQAREEERQAKARVEKLSAAEQQQDQSSSDEGLQKTAVMWTVVHSKRRAGKEGAHGKDDPGESKSVLDKVKDFGKKMCEGREDHAQCRRFFKDDEEETSSAPPATTTEAAPVTTQSVAETSSAAEVKEESTSLESGSTTVAAPAQSDGKQPRLQSQGFRGPLVKHEDGDTQTADWHKEYPLEKKAQGAAKSGSRRLGYSLTLLSVVVPLLCIAAGADL